MFRPSVCSICCNLYILALDPDENIHGPARSEITEWIKNLIRSRNRHNARLPKGDNPEDIWYNSKEAKTYLPFWDDTHKNLKVGTASGRARSATPSGPSHSVDDPNSSLQLQQTSKGAPDAGKSQNLTDSYSRLL